MSKQLRITYDLANDRMVVLGKTFPLQSYRGYLKSHHPALVLSHRIRMGSDGEWVYDWYALYSESKLRNILNDYILWENTM